MPLSNKKKIVKLFSEIVILSMLLPLSLLAKAVAPSDTAIRYVGRFTEDFRFAWTGSQIETRFIGTTILADLQVVAAAPAGLTIVVDGEPRFLKLGKGRQTYTLAEGLDPKREHQILIIKRSEGSKGTVRFFGFELPDGGELMRPKALEKKLLFVGDSITCGYGNEASDPSEGNTVENENGYMSYALIASRQLLADAMLVCWSGRGMYRNRSKNHDRSGTLPDLFEQTLPYDKATQWNHDQFIPDVVVINLGTNDSADLNGAKGPLAKADFMATYVAFLKKLRGIAPDAKLILTVGPMQAGPVVDWLPEIAAQFDDAHVLIYSKFAGKADVGGHWHPSVQKHKAMAEQLIEVIDS